MSNSNPKRIVSTALALKALREVGYRNTATAIAELVDNSLEAEADDILIITQSKYSSRNNKRPIYRVHKISVLDNGEGMDPSELGNCLSLGWGTRLNSRSGLGRFGFGLKGASISQARRIDVYSWRNGRCFRTYLDLDEIENSHQDLLPPIEECELPSVYKNKFEEFLGASGTLVEWSRLDKIDFSKPATLLNRMEGDLCRIYRHFLDDDDTYGRKRNILMCDFDLDEYSLKGKVALKANDPLYLLEPSNVPGAEGKATNKPFEDPYSLDIEYAPGMWSKVEIRLSVVYPSIQVKMAGSTLLGKHYLNNTGISFVRAEREIDFGSFGFLKNAADTRNRWWGVEVRFSPELDELFGVTNNKQQIRGIRRLDPKYDTEILESLYDISNEEENDGRFKAKLQLELSKHLDLKIEKMMAQIVQRNVGGRTSLRVTGGKDPVVENVNTDVKLDSTQTDSRERAKIKSDEEKIKERVQLIHDTRKDLSEEQQSALARQTLDYTIDIIKGEWPGNMFLDVQMIANAAVGVVNTRSPYYQKFWGFLEDADDDQAINALKVFIMAYIRTEDELRVKRVQQEFEEFRDRWGYWVSHFMKYVGE